ncbi:baculoviral IAP repeat-containing protein 7-B-like [Ruditapes philippinarum]|uniref:baculoviral IAP repeat-containing protein 7-B-like n=1 Tax=Ruditapes philippinarum TaxID=129788 RepID=UPI00295B7752|nr:baculoviral IAP repeat-containing protein 7-B-like [Ruditapes philippinarum]
MTRENSADFPIFSIPGPIHAENDWTVTEKGSIITTVSEHDQSHRENIADDVHQPSEDCRYVNDSQTNDRGNLNKRTTILQTNGQLEYYPGISTERPKHPDYGIKSVRLSSFTNWNQGIVDPTQLAEAGFFYTGDRDCVTCFFCGDGMKGWEEGDNPWIEHARWFPNCSFVKQCKGDNFVNMCRMANINYMSAMDKWKIL